MELAPNATLAEAAHVSQAVKVAVFDAVEEARDVQVIARPKRGSCTRQRGAA